MSLLYFKDAFCYSRLEFKSPSISICNCFSKSCLYHYSLLNFPHCLITVMTGSNAFWRSHHVIKEQYCVALKILTSHFYIMPAHSVRFHSIWSESTILSSKIHSKYYIKIRFLVNIIIYLPNFLSRFCLP